MPVRKIRIALIEDSPTIRLYYKKIFEANGFEVLEAATAKEGWETICDHRPDLVVLDIVLPEIHGVELLKRIRSFDFSKHIPVLVLSSVKNPEIVKSIFAAGADHYSLKGMDSPDLIKQRIYELLKNAQSRLPRKEGEEESPITDIEKRLWWV